MFEHEFEPVDLELIMDILLHFSHMGTLSITSCDCFAMEGHLIYMC